MDEAQVDPEYKALDRLLDALGQSVATHVRLSPRSSSVAPTIRQSVLAAWRESAVPVQVTTLPRGVSLEVVLRGVLRHFLPGATAVVLPLLTFLLLFNPFDWATNVPIPLGVLAAVTVGFGLGLGAISRWLFPHSNPDGQRSEVAGLVSALVALVVGPGVAMATGLRANAAVFISVWTVALLSGLTLAVVSNLPWLRPTPRIARPSPPNRWTKLRATVSMGGVGAGVFGMANLALWLAVEGFQLGWDGVTRALIQGVPRGFLIGVVFAIGLGLVYRRMPVDQLRPWRVGLWGAAAASVPAVTLVTLRTFIWDVELSLPHPLVEFTLVFFGSCLPGFVLAFVAVKLAQAPDGASSALVASSHSPPTIE